MAAKNQRKRQLEFASCGVLSQNFRIIRKRYFGELCEDTRLADVEARFKITVYNRIIDCHLTVEKLFRSHG